MLFAQQYEMRPVSRSVKRATHGVQRCCDQAVAAPAAIALLHETDVGEFGSQILTQQRQRSRCFAVNMKCVAIICSINGFDEV